MMPVMSETMSAGDAQSALTAAQAAADRVRGPARWMSTYLGVFAVAWPVLTFVIGMGSRTAMVYTMIIAWPLIVILAVLWSRRRPATLRGAGKRTAPFWGATAAVYGIVLATGASMALAGVMEVPYLFNPAVNLLSFVFSAGIGVLFGYFPARRAAQLDPIEALRHE